MASSSDMEDSNGEDDSGEDDNGANDDARNVATKRRRVMDDVCMC